MIINRKIILGLLCILTVIGIRFSPLGNYFSFDNLILYKDSLHSLASNYYLEFILIYTVFYMLAVAISIPGAAIFTMAGGFIFGVALTTILVNVAATLGACGIFLISRYLIGDYIQVRYQDQLKGFNKEVSSHGHNYLLMVRLIPIFPFFVINVVAALTKISIFTFAWTTSIGIIPGTIAYAFVGSQLNYIDSPRDILSKEILLAFVVLGLIALIPIMLKKIKDRLWLKS